MKSQLIKILVALLSAMILIFPLGAYGEPLSSGLELGEAAPYAGVLLNDEAVARIISEKESSKEECALELGRTEEMMEAECEMMMDDLLLSLDIQKKEWEIIVSAKDEEINGLKEIVTDGGNEIWWLIGGVGIGAVIAGGIVAIAIAVGG